MDFSHIPALLLIGFAILAGSVGGRLFQRLRIPQVVGYIVIGLIVGRSGLQIVDDAVLRALTPLNFLALGIIGFLIGGELHRRVFQKYGKQFLIVLLAEGVTAALLVGVLVGGLTYAVTGDARTATALGLLLGAIASATAPAATVDVLWEYKTRGILTTTVLAIVALDDGLALLLFSLASSLASTLTGTGEASLLAGLGHTAVSIGGSALLGVGAGVALNALVRSIHDHGKHLTFIVGVLTLVLGIATMLDLDIILAAMTLGATLVNLAPNRSRETFHLAERFAQPIYVLFFVFVGARLSLDGLTPMMWAIAAAYVIGRSGGKFLGAWLGARWAHAAEAVRRYLGLCLFSQAGVAIGLAIMAGLRFGDQRIGDMAMGDAIVMIVAATTFIVQLVGPPCVKLAVTKAGERGLNVTEEDLLRSLSVRDVLDPDVPAFPESATVSDVMRTVADTEGMHYAVLDENRKVLGTLTLETIKHCLADVEMGAWLVAADLAEPARETVGPDTPLAEAVQRLRDAGLEAVPVTRGPEGPYEGMLELRTCEKRISHEVWRRRRQADGPAEGTAQ
jgi:Kef-type K+ transport system membrane component KefB